MTSGSYFPPMLKQVAIRKEGGGERKLGIPTVGDRVAQMVVKDYLEPVLELEFDESSYGYRPGRHGHDAVRVCRENCRKYDWVVDLDIKGFFDHMDHDLLHKALSKHNREKWVHMYVDRWLKARVATLEGVKDRDLGTPQGGVISPLLANLYFHYAIDKWLRIRFDFLGFTFKPRQTKGKRGGLYLGFNPGMSRKAIKRRSDIVKTMTEKVNSIAGLTEMSYLLTPKVKGWINYYGKLRKSEMQRLWHLISRRLIYWISRHYKRVNRSVRQAKVFLKRLYKQNPFMFYHLYFQAPSTERQEPYESRGSRTVL